MDPAVRQKISALRELCTRYGVRRLELFGSAATGGFDSSRRSDLDFLVEFLPLEPGQYANAYFGLKEELEALFARDVDLVMDSAIVNPYFREELDRTRTALYAA
jgi:predicted nucleotidyltransferase